MSDPISLGLMGLSTGFGVMNSLAESRAVSAQYQSSAEAAKHNARVQNMNAQREAQEGATRETMVRKQGRQEAGSLAAALAQNGLYGGTSTGVFEQSLVNSELDALSTRYSAGSQATAYRQDAINSLYEGKNYEMSAKAAKSAGWGGVLGSVLSGVGMAYGQGLFGTGGKVVDTTLNTGGLVAGLFDPKKPGFSTTGNRTATRGGFKSENLLGGMLR